MFSRKISIAAGAAGVAAFLLLAMVSSASAGTFAILHDFASLPGNRDGGDPYAGLTADADGNLYGTTTNGGTSTGGTVFELTPATGALQVLYNFCTQARCADGASPASSLVFDADGNIYGTTVAGGANLAGTVFRLSPPANAAAGTWRLTTLYSFCAVNTPANCADGRIGPAPAPGILLDAAGSLYGMTAEGGDPKCVGGCGTIYRLDPGPRKASPWQLTTLYTFCTPPEQIPSGCADGNSPAGDLVADPAGNLYGVTTLGGAAVNGTVFRLSPKGQLKTLTDFPAAKGADGFHPQAGVVIDARGNLYGTAAQGGAGFVESIGQGGVVFRLTGTGGLTLLHSFCLQANCVDGKGPAAAVTRNTTGDFYGTTYTGGLHASRGTLFSLTGAAHTFHLLHSFCAQTGCSDGQNPTAPVLLGADGTLYGTTTGGGNPGHGTLFAYTP